MLNRFEPFPSQNPGYATGRSSYSAAITWYKSDLMATKFGIVLFFLQSASWIKLLLGGGSGVGRGGLTRLEPPPFVLHQLQLSLNHCDLSIYSALYCMHA